MILEIDETVGTAGTTVVDPTVAQTPEAAATSAEAFAERVLGAVLGMQEVQAIYLGDRLGWYAALAAAGPLNSVELAQRTGTAERYAREWLEHQAVFGYLTVDDVAAPAARRRYTLPAAHAEVLVDADNLNYLAPLGRFATASTIQLGAVAEACRTGGGVPWEQFGADAREAQSAANRPMFLSLLCQELLPAAPKIYDRLVDGGRVADIGCGEGWSTIALARGFPAVTVDGFDPDVPSITAAERNADAYGVADRIRFHAVDAATAINRDAAGDVREGSYHLVFAFECVHDMPDPVAVLATARRMLGDGGSVVVMDERTEETFTAPGSTTERLFYGYSLAGCLPDGMSRQPSVGTGTVMRPATLAGYAERAGFSATEVLPIEHDFFRFYRLIP